jgi:uncharacterized membrane protein YqjE
VLKRAVTAVSLLVRHARAYGDLIADDVESAYAAFVRRLWVGVVLAAAVVFSVVMACVWAIAATWDTPARQWLIAGLFGLFVLTSLVAFLALKALKNPPPSLLPKTRLEWEKDRLLLDDLLARSGGGAT